MHDNFLYSLDEYLVTYFVLNYLNLCDQKSFYLTSKKYYCKFYRYFGLKKGLKFLKCFKKNCSLNRFCPVSSPISSFCIKHLPRSPKSNLGGACFLLVENGKTKTRKMKKVESFSWGTLYEHVKINDT